MIDAVEVHWGVLCHARLMDLKRPGQFRGDRYNSTHYDCCDTTGISGSLPPRTLQISGELAKASAAAGRPERPVQFLVLAS